MRHSPFNFGSFSLFVVTCGLLSVATPDARADIVLVNQSNKWIHAWAYKGSGDTTTVAPGKTVTIKPDLNARTDGWFLFYSDTQRSVPTTRITALLASGNPATANRGLLQQSIEAAVQDVSIGGITNRNKPILVALHGKAEWTNDDWLTYIRAAHPQPLINWRNATVTCELKNDTPPTVRLYRTKFDFNAEQLGRVRVPDLIGKTLDNRLREQMRSVKLQTMSQDMQLLTKAGFPFTMKHFGQDVNIRAGQVFSQDPAPGTQVPRGTRIYLLRMIDPPQ